MLINKSILLPQVHLHRMPPVNLKKGDERFFQHEYEIDLPEVFLYEFANVYITQEGVVFKGLKTYDANIIDSRHKKIKYILSRYINSPKIALSQKETYILAFDSWSNGYFHWMCDVLPRLLSIENKLQQSFLLLPENYSNAYVLETLDYLKLKGIQLIPKNSFVHVQHLLLPEHVATTGNYNRDIMHVLRNKLLANRTSTGTVDRIYISRRKAKYRYVINEDEVVSVVKKYGFEIRCFEDFSFHQQVEIMYNCRFLIGIIGANLTNMIFMPEGGSVLQFTQKDNKYDNCYFSLASIFNHRFLCQFCQYEDTIPGAFWNLFVDIDELEKNIQLMLKK